MRDGDAAFSQGFSLTKSWPLDEGVMEFALCYLKR